MRRAAAAVAMFALAVIAAAPSFADGRDDEPEMIEVPVWVTTPAGTSPGDLPPEAFELRVNDEVQPIELFDTFAVAGDHAGYLLGFHRRDDGPGTVQLRIDGVAHAYWHGRFGQASKDSFDGFFLADTSRGGVEKSGVPIEVFTDPGAKGAEIDIRFPRGDVAGLLGEEDDGIGLFLNVINEFGDRTVTARKHILFDARTRSCGPLTVRQWFDLPPGRYIGRACLTLRGSVVGFTRTEFVVGEP